jgi:fructuronate reductase
VSDLRLNPFALGTFAPADAERYSYDRDGQAVGIVHFGIGAFHRAHQAWYTDRAMDAGDRDWGIIGVSLRSGDVAHQMNPQEGLYTVTERSGDGAKTRIIGAVRDVLVAPYEPDAVIAALAVPTTRVASFTITEKGYCRAADGRLDPALAGDESVYHYLGLGLRRRHDAGLPGLTLMSCDNLAENGQQLARLMGEYLALRDPALLAWFEAECTCPSTMVDRIVPATTAADRDQVAETLDGLRDEAAVMTEPFSQWVIEDRFAAGRPAWDKVGAQLVEDVRPYETAKLRMLNGAHSMLAYVGLAQGHTFVHEAVSDPAIRALAERLMREEAGPTIAAAPGQDLSAYADALLDRFANPALNHRLIQIAMDGSQKIPQRWLETLAANQSQGRDCPAILAGISGWIRHLRGANGPVDDPRGAELAELAGRMDCVTGLFGQGGAMASEWHPEAADVLAIEAGL